MNLGKLKKLTKQFVDPSFWPSKRTFFFKANWGCQGAMERMLSEVQMGDRWSCGELFSWVRMDDPPSLRGFFCQKILPLGSTLREWRRDLFARRNQQVTRSSGFSGRWRELEQQEKLEKLERREKKRGELQRVSRESKED